LTICIGFALGIYLGPSLAKVLEVLINPPLRRHPFPTLFNLTQRFLSKDLKWERQEVCEREWEVFLRLEMEFGACSCVGERGRSEYI
jgi:hypothetical protein